MIYVTGDIHGSPRRLNTKNFPMQRELTKSDYVIILGDFGLIWDNSPEEKYWLDWLESKNFTTLFLDGNHENFDLLNAYPIEEWNGGKIHKIRPNIYHLMRGQVFTIADKKIFTFGGAESHDKEHRIIGKSWWREELPSKTEYDIAIKNLESHNNKVDIILTHCFTRKFEKENYTNVGNSDICKFMEYIQDNVDYKHWYFGHYHTDIDLDGKHSILYTKIIEI